MFLALVVYAIDCTKKKLKKLVCKVFKHPLILFKQVSIMALLFKGQKIAIRDWQLDDFEQYRYWMNGDFEWKKYNGPYYPQKTVEEVENQITVWSRQIERRARPRVRHNLAVVDLATNQLIGIVSRYWQSTETNWLSIGIVIFDDKYWSGGIGFEALVLWCNYLWDAMPELVRLDLRTWSGNKAMMRLAQKLGFQLEARFRKARIVNDTYYDSLGYGVLRDEWEY